MQGPTPLVVAIEMGYGHLRAAEPLAERLGTQLLHADRPPLADDKEQKLWREARYFYELGSRLSQLPAVGRPLQLALDALTHIPPLYPYRDLSSPTASARALEGFARRGLGKLLIDRIKSTGEPLLTTFFTPAVLAARGGAGRIYCVVTDSDINRVWAPFDPAHASRIRYFTPSPRAGRRLRAYGVPEAQITMTGFPLPHELLGGDGSDAQGGALVAARRNLAARLVRLDPNRALRRSIEAELERQLGPLPSAEEGRAPLITFAIGGAGAQVGLVPRFLPGLGPSLRAGHFRLALIAGVRPEVRAALEQAVDEARLADCPNVSILFEPEHHAYFTRFHALLGETDVLWTKPSEMTFFGALGLPLLLAPAMGVHEQYNARWARECGAALEQRDLRFAAEWLTDWLTDGTLAAAAWNGWLRMPKRGLYRILETIAAEGR
jgi:hypothetical protein